MAFGIEYEQIRRRINKETEQILVRKVGELIGEELWVSRLHHYINKGRIKISVFNPIGRFDVIHYTLFDTWTNEVTQFKIEFKCNMEDMSLLIKVIDI